MSSPGTLVGRQFCHPQPLEGYLWTHPVLPLREDEFHCSVNEVTHLVLLIMHWCSSSTITDVQDLLKGSNAVCLSPERTNVGNSTVCELDLFLLPILPYFQCFETPTNTVAFYQSVLCSSTVSFVHGWINLSLSKQPGQSLFIMHGLLSLEWRIIMSIESSSSGVE